MNAIVSLRLQLLLGLVAVLANGRTWAQADTFDDGNDTEWSRYNPLDVFGASATYSFPVPISPVINTGTSDGPTRRIMPNTS